MNFLLNRKKNLWHLKQLFIPVPRIRHGQLKPFLGKVELNTPSPQKFRGFCGILDGF